MASKQAGILQGPSDTDPKDPWATHVNGYSVDKVYTRATDGHGHSDLIHVKLSPSLASVVREAIEKIPQYRSLADVIRDAVIHRMHQINTWAPDNVNLQPVDTEVRMAEAEGIKARRAEWDQLIKLVDEQLTALIQEGDLETAAYMIENNDSITSMTLPYQERMNMVLTEHRLRIHKAIASAKALGNFQ